MVDISSPILVITFWIKYLNNKPVEWILKWISGSYHNCLNSFLLGPCVRFGKEKWFEKIF